jgi:hypothetical protein
VAYYPHYETYDVLRNTNITSEQARELSGAVNKCWKTILNKDIDTFKSSMRESFEAQTAMFPNMISDNIMETLDKYRDMAITNANNEIVFSFRIPATIIILILCRSMSDTFFHPGNNGLSDFA